MLRRAHGDGPLATLARLFVAGVAVPGTAARAAGLPDSWLVPAPGGLASPVRLQPLPVDGDLTVVHDPGGSGAEQVLGVGAASLTLAAATPRRRVGRVLDVGTGSGVQALLATGHAATVVGTDRSGRALGFARLSAALSGVRLDLRQGDLLEPVAGERFDLVVANPPFVIAPRPRYGYRDAGLPLDEVTRRLVQDLPAYLDPGGTAVLLGSWVHRAGQDGGERVLGWFADSDCDGWVVQREVAEPVDYVTAWLRDSDDRDDFDALCEDWLDWLDEQRVTAISFGVLALRRRASGPGRVVFSDAPQPVSGPWGQEVLDHFARRDALDQGLLDRPWRLREDVRRHGVAHPGAQGWQEGPRWIEQTAGLRWSGGVDEDVLALLAGCDGRLPLRALLAVLAAATGASEPEVTEAAGPVLRRLVEQGFLEPVPGD